MLTARLRNLLLRRNASAWISANASNSPDLSKIDVEKTFINRDVQTLLYKLTGLDLEGKVFRERNIAKQERPHYALMTDNMFRESLKLMEERGRKFLQFVPLKEPRPETFAVLSEDPEISGFDVSKFVFTDITFDATNRDRIVVVREPNGVLRTALPEEHDRMNRVYYEQPDRPVFKPKVFTDPFLQEALDANKHEFVLDWACYFFEPDDPEFVKLSRRIYDEIAANNKFDLLRSTRHFGHLVFYLILNNKLPPLLRYFSNQGSLEGTANLIRLFKLVHPDWRIASADSDSDSKVVEDFLKQYKDIRKRIPELHRLLSADKSNVKQIEAGVV